MSLLLNVNNNNDNNNNNNNNNKIMKISSQWLNWLKGIFVISILHKSLSGLSHLGKTCLIYVPKKVPFA